MENEIRVLMYCKVYTDNFSYHPKYMNGKEIFDFLMTDLGCIFEENEEGDPNPIPGDLRLWYLGCNEKHGVLEVENETWEWKRGDSNFDRVQEFINAVNRRGVFTEEQYNTLIEKIEEGRKIDWMYDIGDYLQCKVQGKVWKNKSKKEREESSKFFSKVLEGFKSMGYDVKETGETQRTIEMNAEVKEHKN